MLQVDGRLVVTLLLHDYHVLNTSHCVLSKSVLVSIVAGVSGDGTEGLAVAVEDLGMEGELREGGREGEIQSMFNWEGSELTLRPQQ